MESHDPEANRSEKRPGSRISLQTLIIASAASAAAAFAASRIWGPGTLVSAAATPVIVALVSEFLRRPVQTVAASAKKVPAVYTLPAVRKSTTAAPEDPTHLRADLTRPSPATPDKPQSPTGEPQPGRSVEPTADNAPLADPGAVDHIEADTWRPRWRLAVGTGLVAFAIVVALYTVPDLIAGHSITGSGQPSTFFGGSASSNRKASSTTTSPAQTTTTRTTTVTRTASRTTTTKSTATKSTATKSTTSTTPTTSAATSSSASTTTPTTSTAPAAASTTTPPTTPAP